jgi:hypothetical protein
VNFNFTQFLEYNGISTCKVFKVHGLFVETQFKSPSTNKIAHIQIGETQQLPGNIGQVGQLPKHNHGSRIRRLHTTGTTPKCAVVLNNEVQE